MKILFVFLFLVTVFAWGPDKVKQISGYITVPGPLADNGTHLFYWFFESRNSPETSPFIIWLTGGPGCSSMVALFHENGPYILKNNTLQINPYSWNEISNIMWIDQPVGTGFSYADSYDDYVEDEKAVAEDLYQFLQQFFSQNPQYNYKFYIFGESYAGHYIPAIGARIVSGNSNLQPGDVKIDFRGMAIGNGWVDPEIQYSSYGDFLLDKNLLDNTSTAIYNNVLYPACKGLIDASLWPVAFYECNLAMEGVLGDAEVQIGRSINVYDVTIPCEVQPLCYDFSDADTYLNSDEVKAGLGVRSDIQWQDCNEEVYTLLLGDWVGNFAVDIPIVLASNISVLIYSGDNDFICNALGGNRWVSAMSWPGQEAYVNASPIPWIVDSIERGWLKTVDNFSFLVIYNAGHMVPMNQPKISLDMVEVFID